MLVQVAVFAMLAPATAACLAYLIPTLVGLLPRRDRRFAVPTHSFAVLIPAHNEQAVLPGTLQSLAVLDYPPELVRVYVVADNCTDRTAAIARWCGAVCIVRADTLKRGKGHAVAFGLECLERELPDAVLILDADCRLNATALRELDAAFNCGADAVQCAVRSINADDGPGGFVAAVGTSVDEVRSRGLDRLGLSVRLRGTGMALRRTVLQRVPWAAFGLAEDVEYGRQLRGAGIRVKHCTSAVVSCEAPIAFDELCRQRRRWRAAGILSSKPLILLHLATSTPLAAAFGYTLWASALVALTAAIYLRAIWSVGLGLKRIGHLIRSPGIVLRLGWLTLGSLVRRREAPWERTSRPMEKQIVEFANAVTPMAGMRPTQTTSIWKRPTQSSEVRKAA